MTEKITKNSLTFHSMEKVTRITNKVFDSELLLDLILDYVIHDKIEILIPNVCSCRLVSRLWLQSISRIFLKSQQPLFWFRLSHDIFSIGWNYGVRKVTPDQFIKSVIERKHMGKHCPPYAIKATCDFFKKDNAHDFLHCLATCGSSLVELDLSISTDGNVQPLSSNMSLPSLRSLSVYLNIIYEYSATVRNMDDKTHFIQSILDASKQLQEFTFDSTLHSNSVLDSLEGFIFPASITQVGFNCALDDSKLEILVKKPLPNLRILKLLVNCTPFRDGLITAVLKNVRKTLTTFYVGDTEMQGLTRAATTFRLPRMKKLENLKIETANLELKRNYSCLQNRVPMLKHMTLTFQTISMFRKWAENSCFHSVHSLTVSLSTGEYDYGEEQSPINQLASFDLETIEILKAAYPNIQKLDVTLGGQVKIGFVFLMKEMTHVQHLCIRTMATAEMGSSPVWDALLTGIPEKLVASLKIFPDLREKLHVEENPSIRKMNVLHTLELESLNVLNFPLISYASFHYGFLQMPNLSKLVLKGGFFTTREMEANWREMGRVIEADYVDCVFNHAKG